MPGPSINGRAVSPGKGKGNFVPRHNYRQVKKQKEQSRKARQLEKQQRRTTRPNAAEETAAPLQHPDPADPASSGQV